MYSREGMQFKPLGSDRIVGRAFPLFGVRATNEHRSTLAADSLHTRHATSTISCPTLFTTPIYSHEALGNWFHPNHPWTAHIINRSLLRFGPSKTLGHRRPDGGVEMTPVLPICTASITLKP